MADEIIKIIEYVSGNEVVQGVTIFVLVVNAVFVVLFIVFFITVLRMIIKGFKDFK